MDWIKVSEEKPPRTEFNDRNAPDVIGEQKPILVATESGRVMETIYGGLGFANIPNAEKVTHWMPMPDSPQLPTEHTERQHETR